MVKVATTTEGEMRFACELPYQQQCWLVNASVPDGISVVIAPEGRYLVPAQIIVHAGQWPVFNDKGRFMYFVERRPPDVGLILNVPHPDIYQHFYPGP